MAELNGAELIAAERKRQVEVEGWTPEHDDEHDDGSMAQAGACYAFAAVNVVNGWLPENVLSWCDFPWSSKEFKPSRDPIGNLIKAGALIAAEIDRLQRKAERNG